MSSPGGAGLMFTPVAGAEHAIESTIARDLARKAVLATPVVILAIALWRGGGGALGAVAALAVVTANFLLAAAMLGRAARISAGALTAAALGGFVVRLGLITVAGLGVKQIDAVDFPVFCIVLIAAHLGLLFWEMRAVSLTLAYPGLKPKKERA